jgi:hypothetical protein
MRENSSALLAEITLEGTEAGCKKNRQSACLRHRTAGTCGPIPGQLALHLAIHWLVAPCILRTMEYLGAAP